VRVLLKHKLEIAIFFGLIVLYFALRLPNLTSQPIFADEAIYIRWAQIMKSEPTLRFISLQDGKTPLFMWAMIPLFKIFDDPLFAGRFLSVISGFFTLLGVFALSWRVFNSRVALWAVLLYVIVPYTVFFDRMALVDSMLAAFSIWALFIAIWLLQKPRLDLAMILGYLLGGAWIVKTPAMLNLLALPFTVIGLNFKNLSKKSLFKLFLLWLVAILFAQLIYNSLRLGPEFNQLASRNGDYVFSLQELQGRPLDPFLPHFGDVKEWFMKLITLPVTALILMGIYFSIKTKNRLSWAVLVWVLIPTLILMAFLKTFTARYLLFCVPPLLVIAAYGLDSLLKKVKLNYKTGTILALILIVPLVFYNSYLLVTNFAAASLPHNERAGYFEDWTAGYGFSEIAQYLLEENKKQPIVVGTDGFFGTLPDGLYIYLDKANIPVVGSGATVSAMLRETASQKVTFFVSNTKEYVVLNKAELIKKYLKIKPLDKKPQEVIKLYRLLP